MTQHFVDRARPIQYWLIRIDEFLKSLNWTDTLSPLSANDAASTLYDALHYCVLNFAPQVDFKKSKFPICFSNQLKNTVQLKERLMLFTDHREVIRVLWDDVLIHLWKLRNIKSVGPGSLSGFFSLLYKSFSMLPTISCGK